jgi:ribosome-associated toxin RatA of RatAB toxin-antitoxin module
MANVTGSSQAEIEASIERVWALVEDVERAPEWQGGLKSIRVLERDGDGRPVLCESESDAKVRSVKSTVRFAYDPPRRLSWSQQKGELKSVEGRWELDDLGEGRTRARYVLDVDPGRMLGMVIRGPLVDLLRQMLAGARAGELKKEIESG